MCATRTLHRTLKLDTGARTRNLPANDRKQRLMQKVSLRSKARNCTLPLTSWIHRLTCKTAVTKIPSFFQSRSSESRRPACVFKRYLGDVSSSKHFEEQKADGMKSQEKISESNSLLQVAELHNKRRCSVPNRVLALYSVSSRASLHHSKASVCRAFPSSFLRGMLTASMFPPKHRFPM
jgi:hypothetical protein